jgi:predicted metal-binding protein
MDGTIPPRTTPKATLVICTTCKDAAWQGEGPRPGAQLHAALAAADLPAGVTVRAVECLSVCGDGCTVALQAPGKWSYVYARLSAAHIPAILDGAGRYAAAPDGIVPWRERPEVFRKQSVARIPPLEPT